MRGLFITGTDTGVGKTWISLAIIRALRRENIRVGAYKPVASGVDDHSFSDPHLLWQAIGQNVSPSMVCPQMFAAPAAPPLAASIEGKIVDAELLTVGADAWRDQCDFLVVEGAGGLLSPLTFDSTNADLAMKLGFPIVIVAIDRLGVVNQSLLAYEAASTRNLHVAAMVINSVSESKEPRVGTQHTLHPEVTEKDIGRVSESSHVSMIQRQLQAAGRRIPPIIEFAHGQIEFSRFDWHELRL